MSKERFKLSERCMKTGRRMRVPTNLEEGTGPKIEVAVAQSDIVLYPRTPKEKIVPKANQKQLAWIFKNTQGLVVDTELMQANTPVLSDKGIQSLQADEKKGNKEKSGG